MTQEVQPGITPEGVGSSVQSLASSLTPHLQKACHDRLHNITWFRTDWQRGGAATGTATFTDEHSIDHPVVVKIPVGDRELTWTRRLQSDETDLVVPRLFASDDHLNGYDFGWLVIERLPHGPLGTSWRDGHIPRIAEAIARFHAATAAYPVDREPRVEDWDELLDGVRKNLRDNAIDRKQQWTVAIKTLQQRLGDIVEEWRARPIEGWVHGDLHIANAMSRTSLESGPVCLIDLAEVRPGHWIEDAIYLERQFWAVPERIKQAKPVRLIADARRALDLPVDSEYPRLANIRRALLASTAPRFLRSEGDPRYLAACLDRLESSLAQLK